jgi:hypothetical protein
VIGNIATGAHISSNISNEDGAVQDIAMVHCTWTTATLLYAWSMAMTRRVAVVTPSLTTLAQLRETWLAATAAVPMFWSHPV